MKDVAKLFESKKLVAFDIDGTLADVNGILKKADDHLFQYVLDHYPRIEMETPSSVSQMIHDFQDNNPNSRVSVGSKRREFYSQLAQKAGYAASVGEELYKAWQHERNHYDFYPLVPDLLHLLHDRGYVVVVITDGTADMTFHPEVVDAVDLYVNPQTSNTTKTTGEAYSFVLDKYPHIQPRDCLMIGDNPISDILNAKQKGWDTVFISSEAYACVPADFTIDSVTRLFHLLSRVCSQTSHREDNFSHSREYPSSISSTSAKSVSTMHFSITFTAVKNSSRSSVGYATRGSPAPQPRAPCR